MKTIGNFTIFILLPVILLAATLGGCGRSTQPYFTAVESGTQRARQEQREQETEQEMPVDAGALTVYVCGEVMRPGVYELPSGSRICDAVEAAGGMTKAAGREYWNLAEPLCDGQMLCFPTEDEARERQASAGVSAPAFGGMTADGRVNINAAALEELMTIPGVGQTRAEAILAYRKEHGAFANSRDIMKVSGIGSGLYERMKDCIAVE